MRKIIFAILMIFSAFCNAQDTIVKRDGNRVLSKIIEISETEVKFKKFDFQDGPDFIENKSNIESIIYSNGLKEEFKSQPVDNISEQNVNNGDYYAQPENPTYKIERQGNRFLYNGKRIKDSEMHWILLDRNDDGITMLVEDARRYKKLQYVGLGGLVFGGVGMISFVLGELVDEPGLMVFGGVCAAVAIACPIASIHFKKRRNYSNREAIHLYNSKF